ncbi:unnamed protein product [Linum trigynum]|uniref:Uncharacterized protein n=1 Tax=Linum trigynum TaxID=586398 RepID=A0AAV2DS88_9ROSI
MKKSNHSSLWRAIVKGMNKMKEATCWSVRDGRTTMFWSQPWIECDLRLEEFALVDTSNYERDSMVAEWTTKDDQWDWKKLEEVLPTDILSVIAGMEAPKPDLGEDITIWGLERDMKFRLKSAYKLVTKDDELSHNHP